MNAKRNYPRRKRALTAETVSNVAAQVRDMASRMRTHCQICGRLIQAKHGVIAHHGYTRRQGWQTSSCMGARYRPYEVSCDRIATVIDHIEDFAAKQRKLLATWIAEPPDEIRYQRRDAHGSLRGPDHTFTRPEGFDPHSRHNFGHELSFEHQYDVYKRRHEQNIREAEESIAQLWQRLTNWKPMSGGESS